MVEEAAVKATEEAFWEISRDAFLIGVAVGAVGVAVGGVLAIKSKFYLISKCILIRQLFRQQKKWLID